MEFHGLKKLIETLHPLQRRLLPYLEGPSHAKKNLVTDVIQRSGMDEVDVIRALQWFENQKVLSLNTETKEVISFGNNGKKYSAFKLPERKLLNELVSNKYIPIKDAQQLAKIDLEELGAALGALKQKLAVEIQNNILKITERGKELSLEKWPEEKLLSEIPDGAEIGTLDDETRLGFDILKMRKDIVKLETKKIKEIKLTKLGKSLLEEKIPKNVVDKITPQTIIEGSWKGKMFRRYDVKINVPEISGGRKQHYRRFLEDVRQKFIGLGFKEMSGPVVESEFWNMDALFMPQFHSARDIHDAYYVKDPKYGRLDENVVKKVAAEHKKGWKYDFDFKRTHRLILRTQGTACSVRMLASKDLQIPGKYFGITRCFRHDVIDATHLPDFHQTEGIVIEEGLNIRHLFGLLKMFAKEFTGANEIKVVPGYFPFTEPSCELYAKHPELGWIELGGAGIFRPEVVRPLLGKNVPVLAWGLGIDRIAMFKLGLDDIRELFSHNLQFLRNARVI